VNRVGRALYDPERQLLTVPGALLLIAALAGLAAFLVGVYPGWPG
jgi:hypothetical protein